MAIKDQIGLMHLALDLDDMEKKVNTWEADFLDTVLSQTFPITKDQAKVLKTMEMDYLKD